MDELGLQVSYLVLPDGVPVFDRAGVEVGTVAHVLADETADIFHGLVIRAPLSRGGHLFVSRDQVAGLYERGVRLAVAAADVREVREDAVADEATPSSLTDGLRRAWEWLRGSR